MWYGGHRYCSTVLSNRSLLLELTANPPWLMHLCAPSMTANILEIKINTSDSVCIKHVVPAGIVHLR